jgi:hypothetical protein
MALAGLPCVASHTQSAPSCSSGLSFGNSAAGAGRRITIEFYRGAERRPKKAAERRVTRLCLYAPDALSYNALVTTPKLRSFGGREAPPGLVDDLAQVLALPSATKERLWSVLGPALGETVSRRVGKAVADLARATGAPPTQLARAVQACRALVREAALANLDPAALADDVVAALGPPGADVTALLLQGYDAARVQVANEAMAGALLDHGRVLEGVDWRVDRVVSSQRTEHLPFSVAVLTLRYREFGRAERFTVQATPDQLRALKAVCEKLLG